MIGHPPMMGPEAPVADAEVEFIVRHGFVLNLLSVERGVGGFLL